MPLIIFLTGKNSKSIGVNALTAILTFHVENAMYGFVLAKTETALAHIMDIRKRIIVLYLFLFFFL